MKETRTQSADADSADAIPTMLERLGGESGIDALVGAYYFNVLCDIRVAHFFVDSDINAVRKHHREYLVAALGDGNPRFGHGLRNANRRLVDEQGLDENHFYLMVDILRTTLDNFGYTAELVEHVTARVTAARDMLGTEK